MIELQRLTTVYDPSEDRIRLLGRDKEGQVLCFWLTQRLLNRLIPRLCQGLEQKAAEAGRPPQGLAQPVRTFVEQSFAQQRANAALERQAPVMPAADTPEWRVDTVDTKLGAGGARLTLKGATEAQQAAVTLATPALRQWLGIVYAQFRRADWPMQVWPAWMEEAAAPSPAQLQAGLLH